MEELYNIYKKYKCPECKNANNIEACELRQYNIGKTLYCKCINCNIEGEKQEIGLKF